MKKLLFVLFALLVSGTIFAAELACPQGTNLKCDVNSGYCYCSAVKGPHSI